MNTHHTNRIPTLSFDSHLDRWVFWLNQPTDVTLGFCMHVRCAWNGESWFDYRFYQVDMGEYKQAITLDEYKGRLEDVREHEGDEVAELWREHQEHYTVVPDDHPVFRLQKRWEAMMELELFHPHVNMKEWEGKSFPEHIKKLMDEARHRHMYGDDDPCDHGFMRNPGYHAWKEDGGF